MKWPGLPCQARATPPDGDDAVAAFVSTATEPRVLGLLLIRRGGYSVGIAEGATIVAHRSGTRYLQGRTAAGGWSQQRFARRRANQAKAGLDKAREAIVDVVLPRVADLDEVVAAGERQAVREVLSDPHVQVLNGLLRQDMVPSGKANFAALGDLHARARSVSVLLTTGRRQSLAKWCPVALLLSQGGDRADWPPLVGSCRPEPRADRNRRRTRPL